MAERSGCNGSFFSAAGDRRRDLIIGGLNWGSVGLFQFDLIAFLFGGQAAMISRVLYTIVGAAGLWSISMLFTPREAAHTAGAHADGAGA